MSKSLKIARSTVLIAKSIIPHGPLRRLIQHIMDIIAPPLHIIHVGKCAGGTIRTGLNQLGIRFREIHVAKFSPIQKAQYVVLVRNPVERCISAFNYRKKIVVEQNRIHPEFPQERHVLQKYPDFNALCEALYLNNQPNIKAQNDFENIHHLRERISWYLTPDIIDVIIGQTKSVIVTETIIKDFQKLTKSAEELGHEKKIGSSMNRKLSEKGRQHLEEYIAEDFKVLAKLTQAKKISETTWHQVLKPSSFSLNIEQGQTK